MSTKEQVTEREAAAWARERAVAWLSKRADEESATRVLAALRGPRDGKTRAALVSGLRDLLPSYSLEEFEVAELARAGEATGASAPGRSSRSGR